VRAAPDMVPNPLERQELGPTHGARVGDRSSVVFWIGRERDHSSMRQRLKSYTAYSIGCAVVLGLLWRTQGRFNLGSCLHIPVTNAHPTPSFDARSAAHPLTWPTTTSRGLDGPMS
jgi:hypothetical protein